MKNLKKKGFTIVELVIVIAVIAILSAVLIPTFSNLIKKANLSNDQSFVRNANTTLAFEGALEKFENASDAIDALNRNGFSGKYNTYSTNFHYVYSLENNKMYLVNDENVVIYPEEEDITALWGLYTDNRTSVVEGITKYIAMTNITNSDHYNDVFANGTYTIDLNGYFIAVESDLTGVTANNGIVLGGAIQGEGSSSDYELVDYDGENIDSVQLSELGETVENEFVIKNKVFRKFVHTTDSNTNYVFENCIFYGDGVQFNDTNAANLGIYGTLKNCQFIDTQEGRWAVLSNISLNVIDCTFTNLNGRGAIQIQEQTKEMEINISGCKFTGNGLSYPTIRIIGQVKYDDKNNPYRYADTASFKSLNVSDCQFTSLNKGSGIIGFAYGDSFIKNYDSTNPTLVTFSNNSVNKDITADKYVVAAGANCTLGELFAASIK